MEADGLIAARLVQQERRPNKRLFSLTDAGRQALRDFTAQQPRPSAIRDELLVQVQSVDAGNIDAVCAAITAHRQAAAEKLARYERLRHRLLDGRSEDDYLRQAPRVGPYLTLIRGLAFEQENIRWADLALAVLQKRSAVLT
jgi:DNA-binding PadR family transcriptional regulator